MRKVLYYIYNNKIKDVFLNMAIDDILFECNDDKCFLRIYELDNVVTIGRCQKIVTNNALNKRIKKYVNVTRRITGGGAVFHSLGLTYSLIFNNISLFHNIEDSYFFIHKAIKKVLDTFDNGIVLYDDSNKIEFCGDKACFEKPVNNDLILCGMKIAGGAQKRKKNRLLHQGEIDLSLFINTEYNLNKIRLILRKELPKSFACLLNCDIENSELNEEEYRKALFLSNSKYKNNNWIYRL